MVVIMVVVVVCEIPASCEDLVVMMCGHGVGGDEARRRGSQPEDGFFGEIECGDNGRHCP